MTGCQHAYSDPFQVITGLLPCSNPVCITFSAMLTDALQYGDVGILFRYRMDGKLFNLCRLQAKPKVIIDIIRTLLTTVHQTMHRNAIFKRSVDKFGVACSNFRLTISKNKHRSCTNQRPVKRIKTPSCSDEVHLPRQRYLTKRHNRR